MDGHFGFCCDSMCYHVRETGSIIYSEALDEYGIDVAEDHASMIVIEYCPWCGSKLPDSKREAWFEALEDLGYDRPLEQDIPSEFKSAKWRMDHRSSFPTPMEQI